jgi:hypothetical protein
MQISDEGKIGIALGLLGLGGGGALFVLPHPYADYVGWSLIGVSVLGLILLGLHHFKVRIGGLLLWLRRGGRQMWPQYLMVVSGAIFLVGFVGFLQLNVTPPEQKQTGVSDSNLDALATKKGLEQFFIESDGYWRRLASMPKNISEDDYKKLQGEIDNWSMRVEKFVAERLGPMATARMLQIPEHLQQFSIDSTYPTKIAQDRANTMFALNIQRKGFRTYR